MRAFQCQGTWTGHLFSGVQFDGGTGAPAVGGGSGAGCHCRGSVACAVARGQAIVPGTQVQFEAEAHAQAELHVRLLQHRRRALPVLLLRLLWRPLCITHPLVTLASCIKPRARTGKEPWLRWNGAHQTVRKASYGLLLLQDSLKFQVTCWVCICCRLVCTTSFCVRLSRGRESGSPKHSAWRAALALAGAPPCAAAWTAAC